MKKVIIDTDAGVDDAIAILIAIRNNLDILGITTVSGNVNVEQVTDNVLRVLHFANRDDISVFKGATTALVQQGIPSESTYIHGKFDHYFAMDWAFRAYKEIGMRADLAWAVFGKDTEGNYKNSLEFIEKYPGLDNKITISLGPHSPYICSEDFLKEIADISKESGLKIHIHAAEEAWQIRKSLQEKGKTPIQYLNDIGIIKENTILAHAYYATPQDMEIIKDAGAKVAHAPKTYMRFGDLNDFLPRAMKKGVTVGLATDGPASNGNLSIFEAARIAALLSKVSTRDARIGKIEEIVPLLSPTQKFLNKPVGKVKEGYLADIILIKKDSPRLNPQTNIFANILYSISEEDIDTVIVDGKVVVKEGRLLTIDMNEVIKEANKIAKRIIKHTSDRPMQTFG